MLALSLPVDTPVISIWNSYIITPHSRIHKPGCPRRSPTGTTGDKNIPSVFYGWRIKIKEVNVDVLAIFVAMF